MASRFVPGLRVIMADGSPALLVLESDCPLAATPAVREILPANLPPPPIINRRALASPTEWHHA